MPGPLGHCRAYMRVTQMKAADEMERRMATQTTQSQMNETGAAVPRQVSDVAGAPPVQPDAANAHVSEDIAGPIHGTAMTGAEMVMRALADQGVEHVFGYPGGAVLPIYDALFHQDKVRHILVRHEQGAVHAAEGYARSTGKVGCVLVTSGPGATNAVTGLTDALVRFDPARLHHRPGADPYDRQRRVPGMRYRRHHAAVHKIQLPGQEYRRPASCAA